MTADFACAKIVERADPDRFAATMAGPAETRANLWPLYAFNIEAARAPWAASEPMIAEMRLQFWRDMVADAAQGRARAHEVATPLAALIAAHNLPVETLDALVAARRWDIYRDAHADAEALDGYLEDTGGALMWLAGKILGAPAGAETALRAAGWATGLAAYLRAVPELESRGRLPLVDGRPAGVAALARQGLAKLDIAYAARKTLPAAALLPTWQTRALLTMAATQPARVAQGALQLSDFGRSRRLLWQSLTGRF